MTTYQTTYQEQVQPFINFETKEELDQHFNTLRRHVRAELTKAENEVLFALKKRAAKFPGACKIKLEELIKVVNYAPATVKRALKKGELLGFIKRFQTRKENGRRQGATVYQFQRCEPQNEPQTMSHRPQAAIPCAATDEAAKSDVYTPFSLNAFKSFKDTDITEQAPIAPQLLEEEKAIKREEEKTRQRAARKEALLKKNPDALRVIGLFIDDPEVIDHLCGVVYQEKFIKAPSLKIEEHEQAFRAKLLSILEYWKRKVVGDDTYKQLGKLLRKAIRELLDELVAGTAPKTVARDIPVNGVTQAMIDATDDPFEKQRLINLRKEAQAEYIPQQQHQQPKQQQNARTEIVPDWLDDNKAHWERVEAERRAAREAQYAGMTEEEHLEQVLHKLAEVAGMSVEEFKAAQEAAQAKKVEPVVVEDDDEEDLEAYRQRVLEKLGLA